MQILKLQSNKTIESPKIDLAEWMKKHNVGVTVCSINHGITRAIEYSQHVEENEILRKELINKNN